MLGNDVLGDCTCAAAGHMIECWSANAGVEKVPTDSSIIAAYSSITGYDPHTGANDNGAVCLDVLNFWRKKGIAGSQISAYAALQPGNHDHVRQSLYLFGGVYLGLSLPLSAQTQKVWAVVKGPRGRAGSWGGHAVPVVAYDAKGLTVVTWGMLKTMTWQFFSLYCDEAYALLSNDWLNAGKSPAGFDLAALQQDLHRVAA